LSPFCTFSLTSLDSSVPLGHDQLPIRYTRGIDHQKTKRFTGSIGLTKIVPTATLGFAKSKVSSATTQVAEDAVCPNWDIPTLIPLLGFAVLDSQGGGHK
jgi:hypothetical protein